MALVMSPEYFIRRPSIIVMPCLPFPRRSRSPRKSAARPPRHHTGVQIEPAEPPDAVVTRGNQSWVAAAVHVARNSLYRDNAADHPTKQVRFAVPMEVSPELHPPWQSPLSKRLSTSLVTPTPHRKAAVRLILGAIGYLVVFRVHDGDQARGEILSTRGSFSIRWAARIFLASSMWCPPARSPFFAGPHSPKACHVRFKPQVRW
jgi:hypothetical protein